MNKTCFASSAFFVTAVFLSLAVITSTVSSTEGEDVARPTPISLDVTIDAVSMPKKYYESVSKTSVVCNLCGAIGHELHTSLNEDTTDEDGTQAIDFEMNVGFRLGPDGKMIRSTMSQQVHRTLFKLNDMCHETITSSNYHIAVRKKYLFPEDESSSQVSKINSDEDVFYYLIPNSSYIAFEDVYKADRDEINNGYLPYIESEVRAVMSNYTKDEWLEHYEKFNLSTKEVGLKDIRQYLKNKFESEIAAPHWNESWPKLAERLVSKKLFGIVGDACDLMMEPFEHIINRYNKLLQDKQEAGEKAAEGEEVLIDFDKYCVEDILPSLKCSAGMMNRTWELEMTEVKREMMFAQPKKKETKIIEKIEVDDHGTARYKGRDILGERKSKKDIKGRRKELMQKKFKQFVDDLFDLDPDAIAMLILATVVAPGLPYLLYKYVKRR